MIPPKIQRQECASEIMRQLWGARGEDDPRYNYILGAGVRVGACVEVRACRCVRVGACLRGTLMGRSKGSRWGMGAFYLFVALPFGGRVEGLKGEDILSEVFLVTLGHRV